MVSKRLFVIVVLITVLNFSNVAANESDGIMGSTNFINQVIALNHKDEFTISPQDRFKLFYLLWEVPKKIKPRYDSAFADILRKNNILPNNLDAELENIWKDVCKKVERKYMFIMWMNGPIEMTIEQWSGYKIAVLSYARQLHQDSSANL